MRFVCDCCNDLTNIEADRMEIQGDKLMVYSRGRLVYVADLGQIMLAKLTPTARDCKGANSLKHLTQPKTPGNNHHVCQLANAVKLFTTQCAADAQGTHGGNNRRSLRTDVAGQLNPTWVEWLMGFPPGWIDLNASETL